MTFLSGPSLTILKFVHIFRLLGPVHTELLAKALALEMQKMGRISIVSDASLMLMQSLRAQCEQALSTRKCN